MVLSFYWEWDMLAGSHCWGYYLGTLWYSQVSATHLTHWPPGNLNEILDM